MCKASCRISIYADIGDV